MKKRGEITDHWIRESEIVKFYTERFWFPRSEIHFSINDIIGNLDALPKAAELTTELKIDEEVLEEIAKNILEDYKYQGKSLKEWIEKLKGAEG